MSRYQTEFCNAEAMPQFYEEVKKICIPKPNTTHPNYSEWGESLKGSGRYDRWDANATLSEYTRMANSLHILMDPERTWREGAQASPSDLRGADRSNADRSAAAAAAE